MLLLTTVRPVIKSSHSIRRLLMPVARTGTRFKMLQASRSYGGSFFSCINSLVCLQCKLMSKSRILSSRFSPHGILSFETTITTGLCGIQDATRVWLYGSHQSQMELSCLLVVVFTKCQIEMWKWLCVISFQLIWYHSARNTG